MSPVGRTKNRSCQATVSTQDQTLNYQSRFTVSGTLKHFVHGIHFRCVRFTVSGTLKHLLHDVVNSHSFSVPPKRAGAFYGSKMYFGIVVWMRFELKENKTRCKCKVQNVGGDSSDITLFPPSSSTLRFLYLPMVGSH